MALPDGGAGDCDVHERFNLYTLPDRFYVEPLDKTGARVSDTHLEIDRNIGELQLIKSAESPIPSPQAEMQPIAGIVGCIELVSGTHLLVIKRAQLVGALNDADIQHIVETEVLPFRRNALHLNERQQWFERHFVEMVQLVLAASGFYYSTSLDLSHSLQWLSENATPDFHRLPMVERANARFVWNRRLCTKFMAHPAMSRYVAPIIHGFVGIRQCVLRGNLFKLALISRRSTHRAGVRFHMRGADAQGNSANFIETEQVVEYDRHRQTAQRCLTAFLQVRGSIPLYWSQRPNLKWQPTPYLHPSDDQLEAYRRHMLAQRHNYGGRHVIVNLVNQRGREWRLGGELERVHLQAGLEFVRYAAFDFHGETKALNWQRLAVLRDLLREDVRNFGFLHADLAAAAPAQPRKRLQTGYFRTNCMDCLDRTNVVQAMLAKESLFYQLLHVGVIDDGIPDLELLPDFMAVYKNLWADNGDECSRQYAGTGALKADYTRLGKRTLVGALNDGLNASMRYFKNNFTDGYKQDAIDLFLGNYEVDPENLPSKLEHSLFHLNANGGAVMGAVFAAAMMILCVLVSESMTATFFWLLIFAAFMAFITFNGEEFVNCPKLKVD